MGGMGGGNEGPAKPLYIQVLAFAAFAAGNAGLNLFNSWSLRAYDEPPSWEKPSFNFPVFYTMWHMLISAGVAMILMCTVARPPTGLPSFKQYWEYKDGLVPIAICTFLNNSLNNMSLTMVSLFVNQVIKAQMPLFTTIFSIIFAGKKYSVGIICSVCSIVIGSVLSNADSFTHKDGTATSVAGVVICIVGLVASGLRPVIAMMVMAGTPEKPKLYPTLVLFYDTATAFFCMLTYWVFSNEREASIEYMTTPGQTSLGFTILGFGSLMAFEFNLANYCFILVTSALTTAVGANGIKIFLISYAAILAGVHDPLSWTGIAIVISSIVGYAFFSFKGAQAAKAPAAEAPAPSESTPLAGESK